MTTMNGLTITAKCMDECDTTDCYCAVVAENLDQLIKLVQEPDAVKNLRRLLEAERQWDAITGEGDKKNVH